MKYAIISNGLVNNIVISESKELLENSYTDCLIIEIPIKENLTLEDQNLYIPHVGLGYDKDTGFEQPEIIEQPETIRTNEEIKEDYLNGKEAAEAEGQTIWYDGAWRRLSDEHFAEYEANANTRQDKIKFNIPE